MLPRDYPPFDKVIEGYTKIEPAPEDGRTMYDVYVKEKEGQLLLEIPKNYAEKEVLHWAHRRKRTGFCRSPSWRLLRAMAPIQQTLSAD